jgi:hypothetical protein
VIISGVVIEMRILAGLFRRFVVAESLSGGSRRQWEETICHLCKKNLRGNLGNQNYENGEEELRRLAVMFPSLLPFFLYTVLPPNPGLSVVAKNKFSPLHFQPRTYKQLPSNVCQPLEENFRAENNFGKVPLSVTRFL